MLLTRIALIVTTRCDLHCQHCLRGLSDQKVDFPPELLPRLLNEARLFGANHVGFTGGEPHLHPHFPELVETVVNAGYTWHFVSNGMRTEPYLAVMERFRDSFTGLTLSIDGANAQTHDAIRSKPGAFDCVVASIRKYRQAGYKVDISSNLNAFNKNQLTDLIKLAVDLDACQLNLGGTIPAPGNEDLRLSDAETLSLYQRIQELCKESRIPLHTFSSLYTQGGVHFCGILSLGGVTINSRGEMLFCCDTDGYGAVIGSMFEKSFADLMQDRAGLVAEMQSDRISRIAQGRMGDGFDTCSFCNNYLAEWIAN